MSWQETIDKVILNHFTKLHAAIEMACQASIGKECGVKVTYRDDGGYTVALDHTIPPNTLHEHHAGGGVIGHSFDPYKQPYVEKMISSRDTP